MQASQGLGRLVAALRTLQLQPALQACSGAGTSAAIRPLTSLLSLRTHANQAAPGEPLPPWTPTRELAKRKALPKRMGHLLQVLEKEREEEVARERSIPEFGPGDVLELKLSVPENKRRPAVFKGVCIARRNRGYRTSFTLRNFIGTSGGVERSFPLYSPHLLEVRVLESRRVRRAKLYYLRDRVPREYRVA